MTCLHPDEALEPLDYEGGPADPGEWRCSDCDTVQVSRARADARVRDAMVNTDWSSPLRWHTPLAPPLGVDSLADVTIVQTMDVPDRESSRGAFAYDRPFVPTRARVEYRVRAGADPARAAQDLMSRVSPRGTFWWEMSPEAYRRVLATAPINALYPAPARSLFGVPIRVVAPDVVVARDDDLRLVVEQ